MSKLKLFLDTIYIQSRIGSNAIYGLDYRSCDEDIEYIKKDKYNELEEQNKEMLKVLIETVKDYKKLGWGCDEKRMDSWIKVIEKNTCKPIEEMINN